MGDGRVAERKKRSSFGQLAGWGSAGGTWGSEEQEEAVAQAPRSGIRTPEVTSEVLCCGLTEDGPGKSELI